MAGWKRLARGQCENYRIVAPDGCSESHCMGFEPSGIRDGHQIFIRTPDLDGKLKGLSSPPPQEMRMSESLGLVPCSVPWAPWWGQRPLPDMSSWVLWWKAQQLHWFSWILWIAESGTVCRNLLGMGKDLHNLHIQNYFGRSSHFQQLQTGCKGKWDFREDL